MKSLYLSAKDNRITVKGDSIKDGERGNLEVSGEDLEVSDGYHTMHELYQHRMALNIALFHSWHEADYEVFKSLKHYDETMFDGYFIVMAIMSVGQISYHYKLKHWDDFRIPERVACPPYDGHSSIDILERLRRA